MKRFLALAVVLGLMLGMGLPAFAAEADAKLTKTDYRISAYTVYLKELFNDGGKGKITHVGIADINKDAQPELFYIYKAKGGKCAFHFCGYLDEEVFEFDIETNYIGYSPGSLSLKRYRRNNTSSYIWILQSTGKNSSKRKETLHNVFTRSGDSLNNEMKLRRTWTGKNSKNRYTVDGLETTKTVYDAALNELLYTKHHPAETTHYKNAGAIKKVSSPRKWLGVRNALNAAAVAWKALPPVSK